jgi:hypothetical protein
MSHNSGWIELCDVLQPMRHLMARMGRDFALSELFPDCTSYLSVMGGFFNKKGGGVECESLYADQREIWSARNYTVPGVVTAFRVFGVGDAEGRLVFPSRSCSSDRPA